MQPFAESTGNMTSRFGGVQDRSYPSFQDSSAEADSDLATMPDLFAGLVYDADASVCAMDAEVSKADVTLFKPEALDEAAASSSAPMQVCWLTL